MTRLSATIAALVLLAFVGLAAASGTSYSPSATKACLGAAGKSVQVETPVPVGMRKISPYGTNGGLIWKDGQAGIYIEFGKSPTEAAAMRSLVVKLFGAKTGGAATLVKGNVMAYTNHFKLTSSESSTVERCLH
jgi:hypothetical protein